VGEQVDVPLPLGARGRPAGGGRAHRRRGDARPRGGRTGGRDRSAAPADDVAGVVRRLVAPDRADHRRLLRRSPGRARAAPRSPPVPARRPARARRLRAVGTDLRGLLRPHARRAGRRATGGSRLGGAHARPGDRGERRGLRDVGGPGAHPRALPAPPGRRLLPALERRQRRALAAGKETFTVQLAGRPVHPEAAEVPRALAGGAARKSARRRRAPGSTACWRGWVASIFSAGLDPHAT
jgi:hypothetical protein